MKSLVLKRSACHAQGKGLQLAPHCAPDHTQSLSRSQWYPTLSLSSLAWFTLLSCSTRDNQTPECPSLGVA